MVKGFYLQALDRPPDPGGQAVWVGLANLGGSDEVVLALIIGDSLGEFFAKTAN